MLEASKDIFLDDDWAMVADLPAWAQAYAEKWPVPTCQAAMYWNEPPAGAIVVQNIEVYLNGLADASLVMTDGEVNCGDLAEFSRPQQVIAIEFDSIVRYVEIEGKQLLNTVGRLILPDCLASPVGQAQMLLRLAD